MADDEKKQHEPLPYSLTISVLQNKLSLHLYDKKTKNIYHDEFTPEQLQKDCGFSNKQIGNLSGISKFIASAKAGHNNLKFSISFEQTDPKDVINDNNDNDVEGVHGIDVSTQIAKPDMTERVNIGVVRIVKEDDFFGSMQFVMRLKQLPREQSDLNQDYINDLKEEIMTLKQQRVKEKNELTKKIVALENEVDVLKNIVNESKQRNVNELKKIDTALRTQLDALQLKVEESEQKKQAEQVQPTVSIGKWASTASAENKRVKWNVEKIKPTLNGMISKFEKNGTAAVIGVSGLYRIIFRYTSTDTTAFKQEYNRWGKLYVNGTNIAAQGHCGGNAFGEITDVVQLQIGDKIECYIEERKGADERWCCLIIERLCDCIQ